MSRNSSSSWQTFVQDHLLYANILDDIFLITSYGELVYCWGSQIDNLDCQQFKGVFNAITEKQDLAICQKGFILKRDKDNRVHNVHYKVYKKSLCSMYCLSEDGQSGLIICNLPYGILITTYSQLVRPHVAIELVENACTLLRN